MEISRRRFVAGMGLLPLLRYLPASTIEAAFAQQADQGFRFFDDHQDVKHIREMFFIYILDY